MTYVDGNNCLLYTSSLKGLDFIKEHPEARAEDLIQAFSDDSIDMILCAIGGNDTYQMCIRDRIKANRSDHCDLSCHYIGGI